MDRRLRKDQNAAELKFSDRGDNRKYRNKIKVNMEVQVSNKHLENDRGDSPDKMEKPLESTIDPKPNLSKEKAITKVAQNRNNLTEKVDKTRNEIKFLDITKKRKLAQMYTFRWNVDNTSTLGLKKNENQQSKGGVEQASRVDVVAASPRAKTERNTEARSPKIQGNTKDHIDRHEESILDRKPVIKTVTCKNDAARIYKAVTFVDKKRNITALKIDIPSKSGTGSGTPLKSESQLSRPSSSIKENKEKSPTNRSVKGKRKRVASPDLAATQPVFTEVAKWAPLSVNQLTQPYYEAWVDTTLTAFSRESESDKLSLAQAYENIRTVPITATLDQEMNLADEKCTGRIRVTHKISKRKFSNQRLFKNT